MRYIPLLLIGFVTAACEKKDNDRQTAVSTQAIAEPKYDLFEIRVINYETSKDAPRTPQEYLSIPNATEMMSWTVFYGYDYSCDEEFKQKNCITHKSGEIKVNDEKDPIIWYQLKGVHFRVEVKLPKYKVNCKIALVKNGQIIDAKQQSKNEEDILLFEK